jgi:CheY-like chemotaxis protein
MPQKTILIVDDEELFVQGYKELLNRHFGEEYLNILTAYDGNQAFEIVKREQGCIDIISTDINHPGIHGELLIQIIKSMYPHIKILISTAYADDVKVGYYQNLAEMIIQKPFKTDDFEKVIKKLIQMNEPSKKINVLLADPLCHMKESFQELGYLALCSPDIYDYDLILKEAKIDVALDWKFEDKYRLFDLLKKYNLSLPLLLCKYQYDKIAPDFNEYGFLDFIDISDKPEDLGKQFHMVLQKI